jgi:carboxymethylenebutenolidase
MGEPVEFPVDGVPTGGYLASGGGAGLGLLVIEPHAPDVCDRLAAEGFTALAPNVPAMAGNLSAAVDYLVAHPAVRGHGIGVVGFGAGGGLALWLATARPDQVRAVVPFYGVLPPAGTQPDWDRLEAAVEGHYGEADGSATPELEQELADRNKEVRLFTYPNVGHAFFDDTRPDVYDDDAARQAWVRTLEFLRAKLG